MRKLRLIYLLLLLPFWANAQWIAGGTTQTILSGNKQIRWNFGTNGFVYGYTKGQIDSLFSVGSGVSSVFGRTGAVTAQAGDYAAFYAPISGGGYIPYTGATSTFNRNQQDIIGSFTGGGNTYSDLLSAGSWSQNVHDLTSTYSISSAYQPQNTMHSNIPNGVLANQVFTRYGLDNTKTYGLIDGNVALKFSTPFVGLVTGRTTYGALEYLPKQRIDSLLAPKITLTSLSANSPLIYNNANGTFSIQLAGSSQPGYLSSTDWNIFNNKEPTIAAGTTLQYWRGDKTFQTLNTAVVPELTNLYYTNARGIGSILTGYTSGTGTISSSDNILQAIQKLNGNISTGYIPNNNTATASSGYAFYVSGNGQVGGTFKVGSYVSTASTGISVSQLVTTANNHGIEIARVINPSSASGGVAEFDARTQSLGTFDIDHFVSYQARGKWSSSANTNNMNGLWVLDEMDGSGIVYSRNGVRIEDINKSGAGDLQNDIGLNIATHSKGSLTNYNIVSSGGRNLFSGKVKIGSGGATSPTENLYVIGDTYLDGNVSTATNVNTPILTGGVASGSLIIKHGSSATVNNTLFMNGNGISFGSTGTSGAQYQVNNTYTNSAGGTAYYINNTINSNTNIGSAGTHSDFRTTISGSNTGNFTGSMGWKGASNSLTINSGNTGTMIGAVGNETKINNNSSATATYGVGYMSSELTGFAYRMPFQSQPLAGTDYAHFFVGSYGASVTGAWQLYLSGAQNNYMGGGKTIWGTTSDNGVDMGQFNGSVIATGLKVSSFGGSKALISSGTSITESSVTSTELGYASGLTSSIQAQLNNKVSTATTVAGFALSSNVTLANLSATNGTLTFSSTYNGSTARTIGLNLANANTWTATQSGNVGNNVANGAFYANTSTATGTFHKIGNFVYGSGNGAGDYFLGWGIRQDGSTNLWSRAYTSGSNYLPYISLTTTNQIILGGTVSNSTSDASPTLKPLLTADVSAATISIAGSTTSTTFVKSGGTSSQFLMADGSVSTGGTPVIDATSTSYTMVAGTRYVSDSGSLITFTLPTTATVGQIFIITGGVSGTGLWKISQNSGQTIHGATNTTTGAGGSVTATGQYNSIQIVCVKANTDFTVQSSQGSLTII